MTTAIILVGYDLNRTLYALGSYDLFASHIGPRHKVLVWNGSPSSIAHLAPNATSWYLVSGSNKNHEFSGWQEGLAVLSESSDVYRYIIFANDTIAREDSPTRRAHLLQRLARTITDRRLYDAVGLIHDSPRLGVGNDLGPHPIQNWLCTGCFAISGLLLSKLGGIIDYSMYCSEFTAINNEPTLLNNNTSLALKAHIEDWLSNVEHGWNKAIPKPWSSSEITYLRKKTLMILNEMMLSIKIRQAGAELYEPPFVLESTIERMRRVSVLLAKRLLNTFRID